MKMRKRRRDKRRETNIRGKGRREVIRLLVKEERINGLFEFVFIVLDSD